MSSTKHDVVGKIRAVVLCATPWKASSWYGESNSKLRCEILLPNVLHSLGEVAKLFLDLLLTLALALLVLDLIRVVHVTTTAVQVLHRLHHLLIELDVLRASSCRS